MTYCEVWEESDARGTPSLSLVRKVAAPQKHGNNEDPLRKWAWRHGKPAVQVSKGGTTWE